MKYKVLYAEDSESIQNLVKKTLEKKEVLVKSASNGKVAFDTLLFETFDLALIDIHMPVMSGYELIKKIRKEPTLSNLPIIVLTGDSNEETVTLCMKAGSNDFMIKPFNPLDLYHRIDALVHKNREKFGRVVCTHVYDNNQFKKRNDTRILILDKTNRDAHNIKIALQSLGFLSKNIIHFQTVKELLKVIRDGDFYADLIILDPIFPTPEDGLLAIGKIRLQESGRNIPILLCATETLHPNILDALQIPPTGYFLKPPKLRVLESFISSSKNFANFKNQEYGESLIENGEISRGDLIRALEIHHHFTGDRLPLDLICLILEFVTIEDLIGLYEGSPPPDEIFENLAISEDIVTPFQMNTAKSVQERLSLSFSKTLDLLGLKERERETSAPIKPPMAYQVDVSRILASKAIKALKERNEPNALSFILDGADPNYSDSKKTSLLMHAASLGFVSIIGLLLNKGAKVNAKNEDKWTALTFSVFNKKVYAAQFLIKEGARTDISDVWGRSLKDIAKEKACYGDLASMLNS